MFDQRDDPEHLLSSVESFVGLWHGLPRNWYGIAPEKLAETKIPEPLRRLYGFAGHWPGDNFWSSAFAHQDCLVPFELLATRQGLLVFAWENQCVWRCGTATEGRDPQVWISVDDEPWRPLCDSLAQFLVTLCLHETIFGARHLGSAENVTSYLMTKGRHVTPLWLDGPYASVSGEGWLVWHSFHVVDGRLLVLNDHWCTTNDAEVAHSLPDLFKPPPEPAPEFRTGKPRWENPAIPASVRRHQLECLARQHEEQADFHAKRASSYRQLAVSIAK
jgi:hypothetical protein